jgi:putative endonuclease
MQKGLMMLERQFYEMLMCIYWAFFLSSKRNGTLYTGVTYVLFCRVYEHTEKLVDGFTKKYNVTQLGYAEGFNDAREAI